MKTITSSRQQYKVNRLMRSTSPSLPYRLLSFHKSFLFIMFLLSFEIMFYASMENFHFTDLITHHLVKIDGIKVAVLHFPFRLCKAIWLKRTIGMHRAAIWRGRPPLRDECILCRLMTVLFKLGF